MSERRREVGGQKEERKIEAHPVSCLLWRPLPYTNHQSANNNSEATILFTVERGSHAKENHYNLKAQHLLLSALLCT